MKQSGILSQKEMDNLLQALSEDMEDAEHEEIEELNYIRPLEEIDNTSPEVKTAKRFMKEMDRMNDCISRSQAIDMVKRCLQPEHRNKEVALQMCVDGLSGLPSVQPESRWIPCSERLPEERINPITQDYYEYQCTYCSGLHKSIVDVRHYKFGDGHWWHGAGIMDDYVTAWRELPEPYKGEEE